MQTTEVMKEGMRAAKAIIGREERETDPLRLLTMQHREVDALFAALEAAGPRAHKTKERLVATIIEKLTLHAQLEERLFYPAAREADEDLVLEAVEEHAGVKSLLRKLAPLGADDETFDAKVTVLKELVRHHVKEEEGELFPQCERALGEERLEAIGRKMAARIERAEAGRGGRRRRRN